MKIIGINCSPRKKQTTFTSLTACLAAAAEVSSDIQTDLIDLAGLDIRTCRGCNACARQGGGCVLDDDFDALLPRLTDPDIAGVIIATPVYLGSMASLCKAFLDRSVVLARNGAPWSNVVGGVLAIGAVRHGGQELTIQAVQAALFCHNMVCVGGGTKAAHFGAALWSQGDGIQGDTVGLQTAGDLGRRVAGLARDIHG